MPFISIVQAINGPLLRWVWNSSRSLPHLLGKRTQKPQFTTSDLPLPCGSQNFQNWHKHFVPNLLRWMGSWEDPFGMKYQIREEVAMVHCLFRDSWYDTFWLLHSLRRLSIIGAAMWGKLDTVFFSNFWESDLKYPDADARVSNLQWIIWCSGSYRSHAGPLAPHSFWMFLHPSPEDINGGWEIWLPDRRACSCCGCSTLCYTPYYVCPHINCLVHVVFFKSLIWLFAYATAKLSRSLKST